MSRIIPLVIAGVSILLAPWLVSRPGLVGRRRLLRLVESSDAGAGAGPVRGSLRSSRHGLAAAAAVAGVLGFGGAFGIGVAVLAAAGIMIVLSRDPPAPVAAADEAALVLELIAGCLDAGLPLGDAFAAGRRAGSDPVLVAACEAAGQGLMRGDRPEQAFTSWLADPVLAPFGRAASRAAQTGVAVADELRRSAGRLRAARRTAVRRRVQRVSVFVAVPLGLCFLPAFVCVAVVPTVVGLFPSLH